MDGSADHHRGGDRRKLHWMVAGAERDRVMPHQLDLPGSSHAFGQGDVLIERVGGGGVYLSITGIEGHATLTKESATKLRDWLTEWLAVERPERTPA